MKTITLFLLLSSALNITMAQTNYLTGNVKDDKSNPLHFTFVSDAKAKTAAFTDSTGNFGIMVNLGDALKFQHDGYESNTISNPAGNSLQIVLKAVAAASSTSGTAVSTQSGATSKQLSILSNGDVNTMANGGAISGIGLGHQKGNVHGNRYLSDNFVHGFVISTAGQIIYNPNDLFDFDKISGELLVTHDGKSISQLDQGQFTSFTLFGNGDQTYTYEKTPAIDNGQHYVQLLSTGKKYKIYKVTKTKFVKSDYVNTGVSSRGNDYDEYVDDVDYDVLNVQSGQVQKLSPKKKAIKTIFSADGDKVTKFIADNSGDVDDRYLKNLGNYLNQ